MKCAITGEDIKITFLGKIIGTVIKDENGKKHYISASAQKEYKNDKQKLLELLS